MQTLLINVEDSFLQDFLTIVKNYKDKIQITKDVNLEIDPYFYQRRKQLQQDIFDIDSGKSILVSFEEFSDRADRFEKELESKYADWTRQKVWKWIF